MSEDNKDNKYHPSFVPLIAKINERGYRSPYAYVSFETKEGHVHHVPIGNGIDNLIAMGDSIEDVASFLVDSIAACHPDKHNGHGTKHDTSQFKKAYASAITQLLNTDYDTEYAHQVWLEKMYKKWGGHIPAAVLMPIEDQWRMIIPDFKGDAHVHNVREGALDHLPMPNEENSVPAPIGYYRTEPEEKE
jgi:hypothetical protein